MIHVAGEGGRREFLVLNKAMVVGRRITDIVVDPERHTTVFILDDGGEVHLDGGVMFVAGPVVKGKETA